MDLAEDVAADRTCSSYLRQTALRRIIVAGLLFEKNYLWTLFFSGCSLPTFLLFTRGEFIFRLFLCLLFHHTLFVNLIDRISIYYKPPLHCFTPSIIYPFLIGSFHPHRLRLPASSCASCTFCTFLRFLHFLALPALSCAFFAAHRVNEKNLYNT